MEEDYARQVAEMQAKLGRLLTAQQAQQAKLDQQAKRAKSAPPVSPSASLLQEQDERIGDLEDELENVRSLAELGKPGQTSFLLSGYTSATFRESANGNSSFTAQFNPIFNWKVTDRVFFFGELEFELEDGATEASLEYTSMGYIINDRMMFIAGKFLTPLSNFKENLHAAWINKLPDQPMFASGASRLIPTSSLGAQLRGAVPIGYDSKLTYAVYASNGPGVQNDPMNSPGTVGSLAFNNFDDINESKAVGARLGFFPIPELEITYAFNYGSVGANSGPPLDSVRALIQDFSIAYITENESIGGKLEIRGEIVLSNVDTVDYGDGSGAFNNDRNGGYAQIAYRPTMQDSFLKDLECVFRYDFLNQPTGAPTSYDESRFTVGLNYWVSPSAVFKFAYQIDNVSNDPTGTVQDNNAFMLQFAIGF